MYIWSLMVHFIHVLQQINGLGRVTGLVVIPGHDFDKVVVEGDARLGVEDGGVRSPKKSVETTASSV